jgi:hypothetical protein
LVNERGEEANEEQKQAHMLVAFILERPIVVSHGQNAGVGWGVFAIERRESTKRSGEAAQGDRILQDRQAGPWLTDEEVMV